MYLSHYLKLLTIWLMLMNFCCKLFFLNDKGFTILNDVFCLIKYYTNSAFFVIQWDETWSLKLFSLGNFIVIEILKIVTSYGFLLFVNLIFIVLLFRIIWTIFMIIIEITFFKSLILLLRLTLLSYSLPRLDW